MKTGIGIGIVSALAALALTAAVSATEVEYHATVSQDGQVLYVTACYINGAGYEDCSTDTAYQAPWTPNPLPGDYYIDCQGGWCEVYQWWGRWVFLTTSFVGGPIGMGGSLILYM